MKTTPAASFKAHLSALLDDVSSTHEEVTITRNGEPVAVLLSFEEFEAMRETIALASDRDAQVRIAESDQSFTDGTFASGEDMAAIMNARPGSM